MFEPGLSESTSPVENSNIVLQFVRHGDHDISDKNIGSREYPLMAESKDRLLELKKELGINPDTTVGWAGDNKRSIDTVGILVNPEESKEISNLNKKFKIVVAPELLYKMDSNFKSFKDYLGLSIEQKNLFRVVVEHSDSFKKETGYDFTSYADMYQVIAEYIDRYVSILEKWEKVSFKYNTDSLYRVFCANEYFYASFRSKMEEVLHGKEARDNYVDWYEKNFERNEERKYEEQSLSISRDQNKRVVLNIKDPYGEISFRKEDLSMIIKKES